MAMSNAERQKSYRQRLKARASRNEGRLYEALAAHFQTSADPDGTVRRAYRPPKREKMTPQAKAAEVCEAAWDGVCGALMAVESIAALDQSDTAERVRGCIEEIEATIRPPPSDEVT